MSILNNEKIIINLIKYIPILIVFVFSLILTEIFLHTSNEKYIEKIDKLKQSYIDKNKYFTKQIVEEKLQHIEEKRLNSEKELKKDLQNKVNEFHSIITKVYNTSITKYSKDEVFEIIKDILKSSHFNTPSGYFFIVDNKGFPLLQPHNNKIESNIKITDSFMANMLDTIKNKSERFDTYYWYRFDDMSKKYKKVSYYKYFEPYDILIGTGEYLVDFESRLKEEILQKITKVKYNTVGYFFVIDYDGTYLAHTNKSYIGKNRMDHKNPLGEPIVKNITTFAQQNKHGFIKYSTVDHINKEKKINREKISYITTINDWRWVLGTGFYFDEFNKKVKEEELTLIKEKEIAIRNILVISLIITLIFVILSFYLSKIIQEKFKQYKHNLHRELEENLEKENLLVQQSKSAVMGEMIGNIAHQFKQPLSVLSMVGTNIKADIELDTVDNANLLNVTKNIDRQVKYLSDTIDTFRDFLKPQEENQLVSVEKIIDSSLKIVSKSLENNNIELQKVYSQVSEINLNPSELMQIIINLVNNSIDAFKEHKMKEGKVWIRTFEIEKSIIIEIEDTFGGIPVDYIDKIFDAYFTTKSSSGGTGIGLYIVKTIIEKHFYGSIEVENTNQGVKFTIEIPLKVIKPKSLQT